MSHVVLIAAPRVGLSAHNLAIGRAQRAHLLSLAKATLYKFDRLCSFTKNRAITILHVLFFSVHLFTPAKGWLPDIETLCQSDVQQRHGSSRLNVDVNGNESNGYWHDFIIIRLFSLSLTLLLLCAQLFLLNMMHPIMRNYVNFRLPYLRSKRMIL